MLEPAVPRKMLVEGSWRYWGMSASVDGRRWNGRWGGGGRAEAKRMGERAVAYGSRMRLARDWQIGAMRSEGPTARCETEGVSESWLVVVVVVVVVVKVARCSGGAPDVRMRRSCGTSWTLAQCRRRAASADEPGARSWHETRRTNGRLGERAARPAIARSAPAFETHAPGGTTANRRHGNGQSRIVDPSAPVLSTSSSESTVSATDSRDGLPRSHAHITVRRRLRHVAMAGVTARGYAHVAAAADIVQTRPAYHLAASGFPERG
nr:hypothetical protein CFP56_34932 [Quercus suber]